jgi:glutamine---fructose-6-phosphate transaminase (isomerizing)
MCGIIGYIGKLNGINILLNGLKMLQNRGYDSAGISYIVDNNIYIEKYASTDTNNSIEKLTTKVKNLQNITNGIAHTRWATHGAKTDENAHPHLDFHNTFSVVHNGIIENYLEVKKFLEENGYEFISETDTEVIVNTISYFLEQTKGSLLKSIEMTSNLLQGTWAVLIQYKLNPSIIIAMKNGSPLLLGKKDDFYIITSEISGFQNLVNEYINLRDKSFIILDIDNDVVYSKYIKSGVNIESYFSDENSVIKLNKELTCLTPDPYRHWMLKEINEQIESSKRALNYGGRLAGSYGIKLGGLEDHMNILLKFKKVKILGCGTSLNAGIFGCTAFSMAGVFETCAFQDASEFYDYSYEKDTLYIVLSQSGETKDVHRSMEIIRKNKGFILAIVNVVESLISRESDCGVYINAGTERGVASTKSFTNQVLILCMIVCWFGRYGNRNCNNDFIDSLLIDIRNFPKKCAKVIDKISKEIDIGHDFEKTSNMFILGRGLNYPIALEGALKIKEISYIHAEGQCGGSLKHGPFALIEKGMPIIIICMNDAHQSRMESAAEEVKARGAVTYLITNNEKMSNTKIFDKLIKVSDCGILSSLLAVIPFQYICYNIALLKGINPDFPRNLAKVVTVDG